MKVFWATVVTVSVIFLLVGVVVGAALGTADATGADCGPPFASDRDSFGGSVYGQDCRGVRIQARQLPVTLILLGASGLVTASGVGLVQAIRSHEERQKAVARP